MGVSSPRGRSFAGRKRSVVGLLALAASAIFLLPVSQASAAEFDNACVNSLIPTQSSSIPVTMTANASPNPVTAGNSVTLSEIKQELAIPPAVFIAGYNAGVLTTGANKIPTEVLTRIIGTNTVEEEQLTNLVATEAETTITDPDETPGTGDETATPAVVSVTYENQTWTAKEPGPIEFREKTQEPLTNLSGGIQIESVVSGIIHVRFGCDPGNVEESAPPETIELVNPAVPFASTEAIAPAGGPPLTLNIEEGSGTVVSNPAGLECTGAAVTTCETEEIEEGTVTLTASPAPGYIFKSWKKCDKKELIGEVQYGVNGRQCTINLNEAKTVGANFIPVWDLTISKAEGSGPGLAKTKPGGVTCSYNCTTGTAAFKDIAAPGGKPVEILTKPYKHFHLVEFLNGTGQTEACNGNTSCSYEPAGEDSSVEVLFAEDTKYALSLAKTGGGQAFIKTKPAGIVCVYTCSEAEAEYYEGEVLEVSVKLNKGTTSLQWTSGAGTCTGTIETVEATCTVTMAEAQELVADLQ